MTRGRKQREPMERLVRLTAVLSDAGEQGVPAAMLMEVAGFEDNSSTDALSREFRHLRSQGWQIDNIAAEGAAAVWRLRTGDSRLRLRLTAAQQGALQRAALLADRRDLALRLGLEPDAVQPVSEVAVRRPEDLEHLDAAMRAVQRHATVAFRYHGRDRLVHPASVRHQNQQWYLSGREDDAAEVKHFVVSRMSAVRLGPAGSGERIEPIRRLALHPLAWDVDEPVDVEIEVAHDYVPDAVRWLREPADRREMSGRCRLIYRVTHRAAMRARLYLLGERVRVVGPPDFRAEVLGELRDMAGV